MQTPLDPCAALVARLKDRPELAFEEFLGGVRIAPPAPNGFALELRRSAGRWTVFLGSAGFHETFTSAEEVLNFVGWCYSGGARVREVWRGNSPQKASLEALEHGVWRVAYGLGNGLHLRAILERDQRNRIAESRPFAVLDMTRSRGSRPH